MDKIKYELNSQEFLESRKRKAGVPMEHEELHGIQKRRTQRVPLQILPDYKKGKEDQVEKYIQDLETKNKTLLAKCTDLSNLNKKLTEENMKYSNKLKKPDGSSSQNLSVKSSVQQVSIEPKVVPHKVKRSTEILNTQALVALWEEISSTPLPHCSCSKSQAAIKRRANPRRKYKAYQA